MWSWLQSSRKMILISIYFQRKNIQFIWQFEVSVLWMLSQMAKTSFPPNCCWDFPAATSSLKRNVHFQIENIEDTLTPLWEFHMNYFCWRDISSLSCKTRNNKTSHQKCSHHFQQLFTMCPFTSERQSKVYSKKISLLINDILWQIPHPLVCGVEMLSLCWSARRGELESFLNCPLPWLGCWGDTFYFLGKL